MQNMTTRDVDRSFRMDLRVRSSTSKEAKRHEQFAGSAPN